MVAPVIPGLTDHEIEAILKAARDAWRKDYVAAFGHRQRGSGPYADQIAARFRLARQRVGMADERLKLTTDLFVRPIVKGEQLPLF